MSELAVLRSYPMVHNPVVIHQTQNAIVLYNPGVQSIVAFEFDSSPLNIVPYGSSSSSSATVVYTDTNYFKTLQDSVNQDPRNDDPNRGVEPESLNSGYFKRFFVEEKKLGSGSYGSVHLVRHVINGVNLGYYALKKVPVGDSFEWLNIVLTEVKALEQIKQHPNIVNYKHSWLEMDQIATFGPVVPCLYILMEYANIGNLEDYVLSRYGVKQDDSTEEETDPIKRRKRARFSDTTETKPHNTTTTNNNNNNQEGMPDIEVWTFFLDLLFGLDHLHSMGLIHRDIKSPNLLLNREVDGQHGTLIRSRLMISDLGTCTFKRYVGGSSRTGFTGTPEWSAPELISMEYDRADGSAPSSSSSSGYPDYDARADMWGCGLCLYFMAFGKLPWKHNRSEENLLCMEIKNSHFPIPPPTNHQHPRRSNEMIALMQILLNKDPSKRPTSRELLLSPQIQRIVASINDSQIRRLNAQLLIESSSSAPHSFNPGPTNIRNSRRRSTSGSSKNSKITPPLLPPPSTTNTTTPYLGRVDTSGNKKDILANWKLDDHQNATTSTTSSTLPQHTSIYISKSTIVYSIIYLLKVANISMMCNDNMAPSFLFSFFNMLMGVLLLVISVKEDNNVTPRNHHNSNHRLTSSLADRRKLSILSMIDLIFLTFFLLNDGICPSSGTGWSSFSLLLMYIVMYFISMVVTWSS
eukprot:TRINITY_DN676_c0_g3_i1.p1 TRINITY_DN676_c0_g3~~TRINITY_DN676_c0_g3_i1.p1  ORF type:complete len:692 (+),score=136.75 TRINITY_DN676_c0_g3_i1:23-2098(+)